ncbi:MAG: DUF2934 domain-containing protein [Candidatus Thiodiazotropha sp.]
MEKKRKKKKNKKNKKEKNKVKKAGEKSRKQGNKSGKKSSDVSTKERLEMIATAAYYIAEKHGFNPHRVADDWQEAEQQIDAMLKSGKMD